MCTLDPPDLLAPLPLSCVQEVAAVTHACNGSASATNPLHPEGPRQTGNIQVRHWLPLAYRLVIRKKKKR